MAFSSERISQNDKLLVAADGTRCIESSKEVIKLQEPFGILNTYRTTQLKRSRHGQTSREENRNGLNVHSSEFEDFALRGDQESTAVGIMEATRLFRLLKSQNQHETIFRNHQLQFKYNQMDEKLLKLAVGLLDAAESFSNQKYDEAERLLGLIFLDSDSCDATGHPIERVIKVFSHDLQERIDQENGTIDLERKVMHMDVVDGIIDMKSMVHEFEQKVPFCQITHFTAIQTILEDVNVASAERIHFIDMGILTESSHWIVLMHALANGDNIHRGTPLEKLKITAVCPYRQIDMEKTVDLLLSSAGSMNLPFTFNSLHSELNKVTKDHFDIDVRETVVVYLQSCFVSLSAYPEKIEALIRTVETLNPCVMLVREIEASTSTASTSSFIDRFHEAVIVCSATFDCYDAILPRENRFREIGERLYFQEIIKNRLLAQDDHGRRFNRCLKIDFWRDHLATFGIVEMEISQASILQAEFMVRECASWRPCSLGVNGKCMIVRWNGTPLLSVSAWKFRRD